MGNRRTWLESRHLGRTPEGAGALEGLETLDATVADRLLARVDEISDISISLAHAFFIAAVSAAQDPERSFEDWNALTEAVLGADRQGRIALEEYLALPPGVQSDTRSDNVRALVDAIGVVRDRSRRLAGTFMRCLGSQIGAMTDTTVHAWRDAVIHILDTGEWRGEFLAGRLVEGAESTIRCFDPRAVELWARLFVKVGSAGRTARCPELPDAFAELSAGERHSLLSCAEELASRSADAPDAFLASATAALVAVGESARADLARAVAASFGDEEVPGALALVPAIAHEVGPQPTALLCRLAASVSAAFPHGAAPLIRTFDRALEEGGTAGVELWAEHGARIGAENTSAGVAHFRLESRTSHKLLSKRSVAVAFEEVEPVLGRYVIMLARKPLRVVSGLGTWFRPPLSAPEDRLIRLSERVDLCDTAESNRLVYKLAAAHAAARWEFGTYDLEITPELCARQIALEGSGEGDDLIAFLDGFPNPLLASVVFQLVEGIRLDACIEREFKGLGPELEELGRLYAENPPPAAPERTGEGLLEALFLMSIGRRAAAELPARLGRFAAAASGIVDRLRAPSATVTDSAEVLLDCYGALALAAARGEEDGSIPAMVDMGGATVIDPLDYADDDAPPPANPYPGAGGEDGPKPIVEGDGGEHDISLEMGGPEDEGGSGRPLTPDELRQLIEAGVDLDIREGRGESEAALGLYITDLMGKLPTETIERLKQAASDGDTRRIRAWLASQRETESHFYDEWDYKIGDYRRRWCRLTEHEIEGDGGTYFHRSLVRSGELVSQIKREFLMMRPENFRKVRGMEDGEEFDLSALVDAHTDRRRKQTPNDRVYVARKREERDVATLFLLDMSASTDEPVEDAPEDEDGELRRVIDVTKDTLVIMSTVLDEIGDAFAIYGFSGHGRDNVEFFHAKAFNERLSPEVRTRLGGIEPKRSTRMGVALRHAARKLAEVNARAKHLILLSDGFPQDFDYGDDRTSNVYGIRDTTVALQELEKQSIKTFCITVDPAGHDYLGDMCPKSRYAVIEDINVLPEEMPHIYRTVTRG